MKRWLIRTFELVVVAPHTGAWIETVIGAVMIEASKVAPHTGAWIETQTFDKKNGKGVSHPTRVRGLKRKKPIYLIGDICRTPHGCVD